MAGLRSGYTTGTTAAAAAMAALIFARAGVVPGHVDVPLPPFSTGETIAVPIERAGWGNGCLAFAEARKDGGDDPDATHGMILRAEIFANVRKGLEIDGGAGIGRATLPGLPIAPGDAAINPVPRAQIRSGLLGISPVLSPLRVVISAPEGEARARRTMNARLGILGGISILGTQGIVRPYSNAAYRASIAEALSVARATGCEKICLGTGRRSIGLMQRLYPDLMPQSFVVAGDFVEESLKLAGDFGRVSWGCFFGKLVKLAQGLGNTHAHAGALDREFLAKIAGMPELAECNTAQAALEYILQKPGPALRRLVELAKGYATKFAGREISIHLFHANGRELARA